MQSVLGDEKTSDFVCALELTLNDHYRKQAPWKIVREEALPDKSLVTRLHFQVSWTKGKRQPLHFDTGLPWFKNDAGPWSPLSVVVHINDGLSTFAPCGPVTAMAKFRSHYLTSQRRPDKAVAFGIQSMLTKMEKDFEASHITRSRAGQCLAFHSGCLPHAGTSWDAIPDPLCPNLKARVVAYFFAIPESEYAQAWSLRLFNPEYPFGLMREGVLPHAVFFFFLTFSFFAGHPNFVHDRQKKTRTQPGRRHFCVACALF